MLNPGHTGRSEIITEYTPEFYADLMRKCWDPNPENRSTVDKYRSSDEGSEKWRIFELAESKHQEIIKSKKYLIKEKNHKNHPGSFYTSRPLSKLIQQVKQDDTSINDLSIRKYLG